MEGQNKKWYYSPSSTGKRIYNAGLLHKLSTHKISDICGLYYQVKIPRGFVDQFLNQPQIFTRMRLSRPMHCFAQSINNQIWECFHKYSNNFQLEKDMREMHTLKALPSVLPFCGSHIYTCPVLSPLTRCFPSGDQAMHRTQFLCPVKTILVQFS